MRKTKDKNHDLWRSSWP